MSLPLSFIENVGEYFASIYFDENLEKDLVEKAAFADEEVKEIKTRLGDLRKDYFAYKENYVTGLRRDIDRLRATREWHTKLLHVLGYDTTSPQGREHIEDDGFIPVRAVCTQGERRQLLVLEMSSQLKPVDGNEPDGLFEQRYDNDEWRTILDLDEDVTISPKEVNLAVSALFMAEEAKRPSYILLLAGNQVYLMERDRWFRGSYLRIDLDLLFSTASAKTNYRELLHALISIDSLSPGSGGQVLLDQLNEASHKRAYAVTKDLKEGVIEAVEALVNEAVWFWGRSTGSRQQPNSNSSAPLTPHRENHRGVRVGLSLPSGSPLGELEGQDGRLNPKALTNDALRLVYRLLFLFYAESREDLELLPLHDEAYQRGYSLNLLRDLEQVRLTTDHSINGYFFDDSLKRLFTLLSKGHRQREWEELQSEKDQSDPRFRTSQGFAMRMLDSPLFRDAELEVLGGVQFRNAVWQKIISSLSLSKENKKFGRGRISYANLDINQLGSVYEGLLSYRGIFADEELIEVHKAGKPEEGTYLVPRTRLDEFVLDRSKGQKKNEVLLDDGKIVSHTPGSFVYRLHGRDRQKSASYYTPQSLTYTTVYFALEETRKKLEAGELRASALMDFKILEPAMGAAAFQNEAIDQVAKLYLEYREREQLGKYYRSNEEGGNAAERNKYRISPSKYRLELQRVKAHIAANNVYGIDLNGTAIELGKLSLWLNVIHTGMETPFFGHRLGQGNAVVGAWLKVYRPKVFLLDAKKPSTKKAWWTKEPEAVTLKATQLKTKVRVDIKRPDDSVYHFLLPDAGMAAAASNKLVGKYFPEHAKVAKEWLKRFTAPITQGEYAILLRLSAKLDTLLLEHLRIVERIDQLNESNHEYYASEKQPKFAFYPYEEKQELLAALYKDQSPYARICLVMDYWCALWFWDVRKADKLPDRAQYYRDLVEILEVDLNPIIPEDPEESEEDSPDWGIVGSEQSSLFAPEKQMTLNEPGLKDRQKSYRNDRERIMGLLNRPELFENIPRLDEVIRLKEQNRFFHQQLEFFEVFALRGGFDLVVGNPPWIKLEFDEKGIISEREPKVLVRKTSSPAVRTLQERWLGDEEVAEMYFSELTQVEGASNFLNATQNYPLLKGQQTNLYKCIVETGFQQIGEVGILGLVHPEGLYEDPKGGRIRREIYQRLRYHFSFRNLDSTHKCNFPGSR